MKKRFCLFALALALSLLALNRVMLREDSEKKPEKKAPASPESWKPGAPERKEHKIWTTRSRG